MMIPTKNERYEILRLAKRARGLYTAEKQALVFVADAQTMEDGVCRKALKRGADYGYAVRQIERGLHGRRRNGKIEFPGLIARGIVARTGYLKGGRAPGGAGLPATYTIDRDALIKFVPELDGPDPNDDNETLKNGDPNPGPLGDPYSDPLLENSDPLGDLRQTRSCSSSLPQVQARGSASDQRESSPTRETALVVVDGRADNLARTDPRTVIEPTVQPPFPPPPPTGERCAGLDPLQESQRSGQSYSNPHRDHSETLITAARLHQLERQQTDAEIFREYKAVFNRLRHDADAYDRATQQERVAKNLSKGRDFDSPLKATAPHRRWAAEIYRAEGRHVALTAWEKFLVEEDHDTVTGTEVTDDNGEPTGKFYSVEVERTWLLYDFVLNHETTKTAASEVLGARH